MLHCVNRFLVDLLYMLVATSCTINRSDGWEFDRTPVHASLIVGRASDFLLLLRPVS